MPSSNDTWSGTHREVGSGASAFAAGRTAMTQVDGGRSASDGGDHVAGLIAAGVFLIEWVVHRRRQRGYWSRERARWVSSRSCAFTRLSPFKQLLEKHQISEVDFLPVDAEGYDFELLKSIDFSTTRPRFVN